MIDVSELVVYSFYRTSESQYPLFSGFDTIMWWSLRGKIFCIAVVVVSDSVVMFRTPLEGATAGCDTMGWNCVTG